MTRRGANRERIYSVIGQVVCERQGEHFVCRDRAAVRTKHKERIAARLEDGK